MYLRKLPHCREKKKTLHRFSANESPCEYQKIHLKMEELKYFLHRKGYPEQRFNTIYSPEKTFKVLNTQFPGSAPLPGLSAPLHSKVLFLRALPSLKTVQAWVIGGVRTAAISQFR